jgi:hypothetical protein
MIVVFPDQHNNQMHHHTLLMDGEFAAHDTAARVIIRPDVKHYLNKKFRYRSEFYEGAAIFN